MLQCAQVVSILRHAVAIGEGSSKLALLSGGPPFSLFDMLLAIRGGSGTSCSICGSPSYVVLSSSWTWILPFCSLYSPFLGCFGSFLF